MSDFFFIVVIFAFILIARGPQAMRGELNPDEAHWIAVARTLSHDPRVWVSADTFSGGPLVPFTLFFLKAIGLPIDSGTLKIASAIVMATNAAVLYLIFGQLSGKTTARLLVLPMTVAISMMAHKDLVAYNSEHIALTVLLIGIYFFARVFRYGSEKRKIDVIMTGIVLGIMPWTKIQGVPLALFVGAASVYLLIRRREARSIPTLILAALAPTLIFSAVIWGYGGIDYFWKSYIEGNLVYATRHVKSNNMQEQLYLFYSLLSSAGELNFFTFASIFTIILGTMLLLVLTPNVMRTDVEKILFAAMLFIISIYCIVAPQNAFVHYVLFAFFPLTLLSGMVIQSCWSLMKNELRRYRNFLQQMSIKVTLAITFIAAMPFYYFQSNFSFHPPYLDQGKNYVEGYLQHGDIIIALNRYFSPGARLVVWGWTSSLWEETDFVLGTRFTNTTWMIWEGPLKQDFTKYFISDLEKNKPVLFVETVAPGFFQHNVRATDGYESNAVVKEYIDTNYVFDTEVKGARIFYRKDYQETKDNWYKNKTIRTPNANDKFRGSVDVFNPDNLGFLGWAVLGENIDDQNVSLALISSSDTLVIDSYRTRRPDVSKMFHNENLALAGFFGMGSPSSVPPGNYQVWLYIENADLTALIDLQRSFQK